MVISPELVRRVPRSLAIRHDILALEADATTITVAIADLEDKEALERVRHATGLAVRPILAARQAIRAHLSAAYATGLAAPSVYARQDGAPAVRSVDEIMRRAIVALASDVHIEPTPSGARLRQRVDGILLEVGRLDADLCTAVTSRIKLLAGMDIADRRQPQDGRYTIHAAGKTIDARVSSIPTIDGEKIVIRLLDQEATVPTFESLGMPGQILERFRRLIHLPYGFVVVTGPTGSGKTTTLYASLGELNTPERNICTVEDPIEVKISGISQVQVNLRAGLAFPSILRSFLRQDPNVIMIGEMRDSETAAVAMSAALSGQLVLTTFHSNDAPRTIERLLELGVARYSLAAGVSAILSQRLVRKLCVACRSESRMPQALAHRYQVDAQATIYEAVGCKLCKNTGYRGRTGLFELLVLDDGIRDALADGASSVLIAALGKENGYKPIVSDGLRKVYAGETSIEELGRVVLLEGLNA